jgi:hypothetical protein
MARHVAKVRRERKRIATLQEIAQLAMELHCDFIPYILDGMDGYAFVLSNCRLVCNKDPACRFDVEIFWGTLSNEAGAERWISIGAGMGNEPLPVATLGRS